MTHNILYQFANTSDGLISGNNRTIRTNPLSERELLLSKNSGTNTSLSNLKKQLLTIYVFDASFIKWVKYGSTTMKPINAARKIFHTKLKENI